MPCPAVQVIKGCWQLSGGHHGDKGTDRTGGQAAVDDLQTFVNAGASDQQCMYICKVWRCPSRRGATASGVCPCKALGSAGSLHLPASHKQCKCRRQLGGWQASPACMLCSSANTMLGGVLMPGHLRLIQMRSLRW